jgi:predicted protein tyrosine phosphatase
MPFAICGVSEVPAFATVLLDHIISFHEVHQPGPDIRAFKYPFTLHSFVFADTGNSSNPLAPTEAMIRRLLGVYAQTSPDQSILFHCFAGVSRSSAAAFIWLVHHRIPYSDAYQLIVNARGPFVCPNQLMVGWADKLMSHNGKMTAFLSAELGRRTVERDKYFSRTSATDSQPRS